MSAMIFFFFFWDKKFVSQFDANERENIPCQHRAREYDDGARHRDGIGTRLMRRRHQRFDLRAYITSDGS